MNELVYESIESNTSCVGSLQDYIALTKPRVMGLVVFTSLCGLLLTKGSIHPFLGLITIICITLGAASSAAINMWYDRDIDAIMFRTKNRPLVRGTVSPDEALGLGVTLGFFAVFLMALCINFISAFLLCFTILYYVFIYTIWLKRSSAQNIVIGGVAGALPPVIGMTAVEGHINLEAFSLFLIIFLWTPPHSWALALWRLEDYKNSKVPMMPLILGVKNTKDQILIYSLLMITSSVLPFFLGMTGIYYLFVSVILNIGFLYYVFRLFNASSNLVFKNKVYKSLFFYSIFYLFGIFFTLGIGTIVL